MTEEKDALELRLATRGSPLARIQAEAVKELLGKEGYSCSLQEFSTMGDRIQDRALSELGGKGLFIKELEKALFVKEAELAVHSLKDLPCRLYDDFELAAYLERDFPHDILVFRKGNFLFPGELVEKEFLTEEDFGHLPPCRIATGSLRRSALIKKTNPQIDILPIRGNIGTRLKKLQGGYADALLLSEASLRRMPYNEELFDFCRLEPSWFIPCAGQGVIVVESLKEGAFSPLAKKLDHFLTRVCCEIERGVLEALGGSCLLPIGVHCTLAGDEYKVSVFVSDKEGEKTLSYQESFQQSSSLEEILREIKAKLYAEGVKNILDSLV